MNAMLVATIHITNLAIGQMYIIVASLVAHMKLLALAPKECTNTCSAMAKRFNTAVPVIMANITYTQQAKQSHATKQ